MRPEVQPSETDSSYYSVLGCSPGATPLELRQAYHRAALRLHPDKCGSSGAEPSEAPSGSGSPAEQQQCFGRVAEAYRTLADPGTRALYDWFGAFAAVADALGGTCAVPSVSDRDASVTRRGPRGSGSLSSAGSLGGSSSSGPAPAGAQRAPMSWSDAGDVVVLAPPARPTGPSPPHRWAAAARSPPPAPRGPVPPGMRRPSSSHSSDDGGEDDAGHSPNPVPSPSSPRKRERAEASAERHQHVELRLGLTLEEMYNGCTKLLRLARRVFRDEPHGGSGGGSGGLTGASVEEVFRVVVKPGWRAGTRVTFSGKGDELPGRAPGDLVLVVAQEPHPCWRRRGDDLYTRVAVPLAMALAGGGRVHLVHLDGRCLQVDLGPGVVQPSSCRTLKGEGMPIARAHTGAARRGDLHVLLQVQFPQHLTPGQKLSLREALGGSSPSPSPSGL